MKALLSCYQGTSKSLLRHFINALLLQLALSLGHSVIAFEPLRHPIKALFQAPYYIKALLLQLALSLGHSVIAFEPMLANIKLLNHRSP
jgi:hypothetical protein